MPKDCNGRTIRKGDKVRRVRSGGNPIPTALREVEIVKHVGTKIVRGRIAVSPIDALGFRMRVWEPASDFELV